MNSLLATWTPASPATVLGEIETLYVLLDKKTLAAILLDGQQTAAFPPFCRLAQRNPSGDQFTGPTNSPRSDKEGLAAWEPAKIDPAAAKHDNYGGNPPQITTINLSLFQYLSVIWGKLVAAGQPVLAERVRLVMVKILNKQPIDPVALATLFDTIQRVMGL